MLDQVSEKLDVGQYKRDIAAATTQQSDIKSLNIESRFDYNIRSWDASIIAIQPDGLTVSVHNIHFCSGCNGRENRAQH